MTGINNQIRLHIENTTRLGEVFNVTEDRLKNALSRHPDVADKVSVTIGQDGKSFHKSVSDADVLFAWDFDRVDLAKNAPNLRLIHLHGAGVNHLLPLDWVPDDVALTNSRGAHGDRASEFLMMALLALNNGLPQICTNQRNKQWLPVHASTIKDKTVLIFGVGHVGGDIAKLAKLFGITVLGVRRSGMAHDHVDEMYQPQDLHALLPNVDFVLITAPHTPSTTHVFGRREFSLMKPGAGVVLYSRAKLVDFDALSNALESGRINAIVDVFDEEPLPASSPLWGKPNLIVTPHSSSNDPIHYSHRSLDLLFENIGRLLRREKLTNVVDLQQEY